MVPFSLIQFPSFFSSRLYPGGLFYFLNVRINISFTVLILESVIWFCSVKPTYWIYIYVFLLVVSFLGQRHSDPFCSSMLMLVYFLVSQYWVSQGNKWCNFCKIFISNNPSSIRNHELGQRHKDNVSKRLNTMREQKVAKEKEQKEAARALEQIEAVSFYKCNDFSLERIVTHYYFISTE